MDSPASFRQFSASARESDPEVVREEFETTCEIAEIRDLSSFARTSPPKAAVLHVTGIRRIMDIAPARMRGPTSEE